MTHWSPGTTDGPAVAECGECGHLARVLPGRGIQCACLPGLSAAERHSLDAERVYRGMEVQAALRRAS